MAHTVTDGEAATRTEIRRDADGRVVRITSADGDGTSTTDHEHDGAGQLVQARTRHADGSVSVRAWRYDAAGRLVAESYDGATVALVHDAAGQLLSRVDTDGRETRSTYDGSGRRTSALDGEDRGVELVWNPSGYLEGTVRRDGDQVRRTDLHVDALGELARVGSTELFWDTAAFAGAPVLAGDTPVLSVGGLTGAGDAWTAPGWRTARTTGADPWSGVAGGTPLDGSASLSASGDLTVDGLEWTGARVYDPVTRGFLSVDPLEPTTGAGWAGNPYAYAGNDPLHALDPTGLHPVTDTELQQYRDGNGIGGTFKAVTGAVGGWLKDNWEYVAGGAMVVAGGVLIATGVVGPAGVMLLLAGADTIIQKATTGEVNWGQVAVSGVAGAVGFGVGGAVAKAAGTGLRGALAAGAAGGAAEGAVNGGGSYLTGPGPHTVDGFITHTTTGMVVGGVAGGAGGAAAHGLSSLGGRGAVAAEPSGVRTLDDVPAQPSTPSPTLTPVSSASSPAKEGIYIVNAKQGVYVGQSNDIDRRLAEHVAAGKFDPSMVSNAARQEVLGGKTTREIAEQNMIDQLGGKRNLLNRVNPVGDRRIALMGPGYVRP